MREDYSTEYSKILEQLKVPALVSAIEEWIQSDESNFLVFEREVRARVMEVERAANALGLQSLDVEHEELQLGDRRYVKAECSTGTYTGLAGSFSVERHLYRPPEGGRSVCPLELRAGILEGNWTPMAAEVMTHSVAIMTPYEATDLLTKFGGFSPSRSSLDRLPKFISEKWEQNRWEWENALRSQETVPTEAVTLAASLDGIKLPMKNGERSRKRAQALKDGKEPRGPNGYREAACATVSVYGAEGERLETVYHARMPESKKPTLQGQLEGEVSSFLQPAPYLNLVLQSDGARDNWRILREMVSSLREQGLLEGVNLFEIVDFFHAAEHLKTATDLYYGTNSAKSRSVWVELRHHLLEDENGVDRVIRKLAYFRNRTRRGSQRRKKLSTELQYFRDRRHQMQYAEYQRLNLPIGTGVNEAACKTLVTQRMKRSGMRWAQEGGQAVLTLRSLIQSKRWDRAWALLAESYRPRIRVVKRVGHLELICALADAA